MARGGQGDAGERVPLAWVGGPGWYAWVGDQGTLRVDGVCSGETKGNDEQAGEHLNDTAATRLYLGPAVELTLGPSFSAGLGVDVPVIRHATAVQIAPDVRVRAGLGWRF